MIYTVKRESAYHDTKTQYSIGQKLTDIDIQNIRDRFKNNNYEIKDDKNKMDMKFFDFDLFKQKFLIYDILLEKLKY